MGDSKFNISDASTLFFFSTCYKVPKTWFELSKVKLYRNDLRGSKNDFELRVVSSYQGFELPRVKLQ